MHLSVKDPNEAKSQYLIKKRKNGLQHHEDLNSYIEYSNNIQDVYKNIGKYNPEKKRKVLIVVHDMISEIFTKHVLQNHILFSLMRVFFSQIIF